MKQNKTKLALTTVTVRALSLGEDQLKQVGGGLTAPPDTKILSRCALTTTIS